MRREKTLALVIAAAAGLRVALLSLSFPFFSPIDEAQHLDIVVKYGQGRLPYGLVPFSDESLHLIALFFSPEYVHPPPHADPPWLQPEERGIPFVRNRLAIWKTHGNIEATHPPLYYFLAGVWCRLGKLADFSEGALLYWIRLFNAPVYALLVWLSYYWIKRLRPDDPFYFLGVPLALAFLPQEAAHAIGNDAVSPLFFGAAFFALLEVIRDIKRSPGACATAGVLTAAALLVKLSNAAIAAVFAVALVLRAARAVRVGGKEWRAPLFLLGGAAIPFLPWCAWNMTTIADPLGGAYKAQVLGWSSRPFAAFAAHPIFTPGGAAYFLHQVMVTLWRGELSWHGVRLGTPWMDGFYSLSSYAALLAAAQALARRKTKDATPAALCLFVVLVSIAYLAALSVNYIFPVDGYPTRGNPFLYSGRLIWGVIVPFLLIYVEGIDRACRALRLPRWKVLGAWLVLMTIVEFSLPARLFQSPYNAFHLPSRAVAAKFQ